MERRRKPTGNDAEGDRQDVARAIQEALARPSRPVFACRHQPVARFPPSQPLEIRLSLEEHSARSVRLHYRHVNQMVWRDKGYKAMVPAEYTQSRYPPQYCFELHSGQGGGSQYPGFEPNLSKQPYFLIRSDS